MPSSCCHCAQRIYPTQDGTYLHWPQHRRLCSVQVGLPSAALWYAEPWQNLLEQEDAKIALRQSLLRESQQIKDKLRDLRQQITQEKIDTHEAQAHTTHVAKLYPTGPITTTIAWFRAHRPLECFYCGCNLTPQKLAKPGDTVLTSDHVIPRVSGGGGNTSNLVSCCGLCNTEKSWRSVDEFRVRRFNHHAPSPKAMFFAELEFARFQATQELLKKPKWWHGSETTQSIEDQKEEA